MSSTISDQTPLASRFALIFTNFYAIGPIINFYRFNHYAEGTILLCSMLASTSYHTCLSFRQTCWMDLPEQNQMDVFFSLMTVPMTCIFFVNLKPRRYKSLTYWLYALFLYVFTHIKLKTSLGLILIASVGISPGIIYLSIIQRFPPFDIKECLGIFISLAIGVISFWLGSDPGPYEIWHNIWHMFIFHVMYILTGPKYWRVLWYFISNLWYKIKGKPDEIVTLNMDSIVEYLDP